MAKRILLFLSIGTTLLAQNPNTAKFPGAVATDQDFLVAKDQSASTLSSGIGDADTSIQVVDGGKFLGYEVVSIEQEQVLICSVTSNTLNVCTGGRGFAGTTSVGHSSGATVRGHITAWHHNQVAVEIKAIQSQLGANLANIAPASQGVTGGDSHDHSGGDGSQIDHTALANKGSNTHAQIDTHLGSTSNPHIVTATQAGAEPAISTGTTSQFWRGDKTWSLVDWSVISGKPSTFTPASHTHPNTEVTGLGDAATKNTGTAAGTVAAGDHSHSGYATTTDLSSHTGNTSNPHSVTRAQLGAAGNVREISYTLFDPSNTLSDSMDIPSIWANRRGSGITITEVRCECDAGGPTINLQRDDGSPANVLSSSLTCTTGGATTTSFSGSEATLSSGHQLDHVTVSASTAKRINITVKYTE